MMRFFSVALLVALLVTLGPAHGEALSFSSGLANPDAVAAVTAGTCAEVSAAWWGFDPEDSTEAIQAALDSGATKVVIPYVGAPWIIRPLMLQSDQEVFLEPGVLILAKKDEFHGGGDSLFWGRSVSNVVFRGYGATLRMRKRDYQQPPYTRAEWRMGLRFDGSTNVLIEGVRIESTGGDGIYIGTTGPQPYCKDVVIRDVVCDDNHRQGISVIGAENLLIENSTFSNTWGTAPGAGIDLEPDTHTQRLVNIIVRNCVFENNEGHEILVYPKHLDENSPPISVLFENCIARKTLTDGRPDGVAQGIGRNDDRHGWSGISVGAVQDTGPGGLIEFVDCTVENTGKESVKVFDKSADKAKVRFTRCRFRNPWLTRHAAHWEMRTPIFFEVRRPALSTRVGGVEFLDCHLWDSVGRPALALSKNNDEYGLHDVQGRIWVHGAQEPRMWLNAESTNIGLELTRVDLVQKAPERKPDADAE